MRAPLCSSNSGFLRSLDSTWLEAFDADKHSHSLLSYAKPLWKRAEISMMLPRRPWQMTCCMPTSPLPMTSCLSSTDLRLTGNMRDYGPRVCRLQFTAVMSILRKVSSSRFSTSVLRLDLCSASWSLTKIENLPASNSTRGLEHSRTSASVIALLFWQSDSTLSPDYIYRPHRTPPAAGTLWAWLLDSPKIWGYTRIQKCILNSMSWGRN
jgi:hypothetical protein